MKCKKCKRAIPENSIYCNWCGVKQIKDEGTGVPDPKQLPSGSWRIQLKKEGVSITAPSKAECILKAQAARAGYLEIKNPDA